MWDWLDEAWDVVSGVGSDVVDWFGGFSDDIVDFVPEIPTTMPMPDSGLGGLLTGAGEFLDIYNPATGDWDWKTIAGAGKSIYDYFEDRETAQRYLDQLNRQQGLYSELLGPLREGLRPEVSRRAIRQEAERVGDVYRDIFDEAQASRSGMFSRRGLGDSSIRTASDIEFAKEKAKTLAGIRPTVEQQYYKNLYSRLPTTGAMQLYQGQPQYSPEYFTASNLLDRGLFSTILRNI